MPLDRARRIVQFGLATLVLGALVILVTALTSPTADLPPSREIVVALAFVLGGAGMLVAWVGWRTLRLASTDDAIAHWTVPPDEWRRYVAACQMRVAMPRALEGTVPLDLPVGAAGVEVHALRRGFRVGETFHELGGLSAELLDVRVVDSPAPMFEFNVTYATGRTSFVRRGVRIPIASHAQSLAKRVEDYWVAREPLQTMSLDELRARERSGWMLSLLGLFLFLAIVALFIVINPPGWAAIGPIGSLGTAGYGFARGIRARSVRMRREGRI